jgi:hypothetical protein
MQIQYGGSVKPVAVMRRKTDDKIHFKLTGTRKGILPNLIGTL